MGGSKGKGKGLFPDQDILLDDAALDDKFYNGDECRLVTFNETFYFMSATSSEGVGGDTDAVGSRFFFDQGIYKLTGEQVPNVVLSGICTRTSTAAGSCNLNFVDLTGNWSITTQGYLATVTTQMTAGSLVVTGGSGNMMSIIGEMVVIPMTNQGMLDFADIFSGVYAYYVEASYGVIICPSPSQGY